MPETKLPPWLAEIEAALEHSAAILGATEPTPMQRLLELCKAQREALDQAVAFIRLDGAALDILDIPEGLRDSLTRARRLWEGGE